jgi:hydrogenase expression/formation protein HypC
MKIKQIAGEFAEVETGRLRRRVNIQMLSKVKIGDYVIVHAGFAIQKLNTAEAKETLKLFDEPRYKLVNNGETGGL